MEKYYISRFLVSAFLGLLVYLAGNSVWVSALSFSIIFVVFVLLIRSGRYKVKTEMGAVALQRDERTQIIADKAGRNAWVIMAVTGGLLILYFGLISPGDVPVSILGGLLLSGWVVYFASDFWLRRL